MIRRYCTFLLCCATVIAGFGCATVRPIGPGYIYEPDTREERLWEASNEASASFRARGAMYDDAELREYAQSVLERVLGNNLSAYIPLEPRVFIIDSPVINAFALPNGHIFLHTGFLGRVRNEAQLAMIMSHEITHATHRHLDQLTDDKMARTDILAYISVLSVLGGGNIHNAMTDLSTLITQAAVTGYSRKKEKEADKVGLTLVSQAGYSPSEAAKMFRQILDATDKKDRRWNALYATHPKVNQRVKSCNRLLKRLHPELLAIAKEVGRDRYVQRAAALIYDEAERHIAQGKFDLSLETLRFMRDVQPANATALALLGDLYRARYEDGDRPLAEEAYREALAIDNGCAEAHRGLGFIYVKSGAPTDAKKHLRTYLTLRPTAHDAKFVQQYVNRLERER